MKFSLGFRQKIIFSVGILTLLVMLALIFFNYNRIQVLIIDNESKHNKFVSEMFYNKMNEYLKISRSVIIPIAQNHKVIDFFAKGDRENLIKFLEPTFAELKDKGFYNIQFNSPPSTAFARLNRPDDFGDDISQIRPSVVVANKDQKEVMGLEGGKAGYGFRVLVPIFNDENFVGTVETGLHFNEKFLDDINKIAPGDYFIYNFGTAGEPDELLSKSAVNEDHYKINLDLISKSKETGQTQYGLTNDRINNVLIMPFRDFSGEMKGYVKAILSREHTINQLAKNKRDSLIIMFLGIGLVLAMLYFIVNSTVRPITKLSQAVEIVSQGDLSKDINIDYKGNDEVKSLITSFSKMVNQMQILIGEIMDKANFVASSSQQLNSSAQETTANANETSATMTEISNMVEQVSANIQEVSTLSKTASEHAGEGSEGINRVIEQMQTIAGTDSAVSLAIDGLNRKSQEIDQIVDLITNIADQTNLLALNAAIEAARAGEQGRGFAVVAEEVRKLAEQSASAAKEIYTLINAIQLESQRAVESMANGGKEVETGTKVVWEVGENFKEIISSVQVLTSQIQEVASATAQMSEEVQNVAASTEEQTAAMEEVSDSAESLTQLSEEFSALVSRFKV